MIIHVVREGDTLYKIGRLYGVDFNKIARDNNIPIHQTLVVGETLVIINDEEQKNFRNIDVNGFVMPSINIDILQHAIQYLSYLSIFSYTTDDEGNLNTINDESLINLAKNNDVLPVMVVTNIGDNGRFNSELASLILNNNESKNRLIENIIKTMSNKGYSGLNIDFEYIYPEDKNTYMDFLRSLKDELKNHGYFLSVAVAPKTSDEQKGVLYEAHDYRQIGEIADHVVIMTYEWGYSGGPARAVAPINLVQRVIEYATSQIPSNKILMGIPNYGYDWTLPYTEGSLAKTLGNPDAISVARENYQQISYDYTAESPYFYYQDKDKIQHEVWFEDARSIQAKLELVMKFNLGGISYWTLNRPFPQNFLVLDDMYIINKYKQ